MRSQMGFRIKYYFLAFLFLPSILILSGCATVNISHPMVVSHEIKPGDPKNYAYAYFIRPKPYKSKGVSDEALRIEFQDEVLLNIDEGSYALIRIKPSKGELKIFNRTKFINKLIPVEVWRAREYKFIEGKTYFIHLKRIDEEFRGVFYEPKPISLEIAKTLSSDLRATGEAKKSTIEKLKNVSAPPTSAVKGLSPALPENVYGREPYLK